MKIDKENVNELLKAINRAEDLVLTGGYQGAEAMLDRARDCVLQIIMEIENEE